MKFHLVHLLLSLCTCFNAIFVLNDQNDNLRGEFFTFVLLKDDQSKGYFLVKRLGRSLVFLKPFRILRKFNMTARSRFQSLLFMLVVCCLRHGKLLHLVLLSYQRRSWC